MKVICNQFPEVQADLNTERACRFLETHPSKSFPDFEDVMSSGTEEPSFEKVTRLIRSHNVSCSSVEYLNDLVTLWIAVRDAKCATEKVMVFDGTDTHYTRARIIDGTWLTIPKTRRPRMLSI